MTRVVVFGASGYTGRLAARQCVQRGLRPLLAGRDQARLRVVAGELGGLDVAVADAQQPDTVRDLLNAGDVLVTTVGPYARYGLSGLEAALEVGAHYLDVAGEPGFVRRVFEDYGPRARQAGVVLLPGFGHDYVPGNLAGALALRQAGTAARRIEVAYFDFRRGGWYSGAPVAAFSSGTLATLMTDAVPDSYAYRGGRLVSERLAGRVRRFRLDGRSVLAVSAGGTEQFTLPRLTTGLTDVETYLGWFGQASLAMPVVTALDAAAARVPGLRAVRRWRSNWLLERTGRGPAPGVFERIECRTIAICYDGSNTELARVDIQGPADPYQATAGLLAVGAEHLAGGTVHATGACGPVEAFGLDAVEEACTGLGFSIRTDR
jgi:short subunit dehydrogenase-like uncharacterized protein